MSRLWALLVLGVLALAALGIYDITRGGGDAAEEPATPASTSVDLTTASTPLGTVVTSGGSTLYRFDKDTPKPSKSNCNGPCATTWPPMLASGGAPRVAGVDPALVGTVARADGAEQLTLGGWPLYRYAADGAPGDTKGEGVGGTWRAAGPSGKPAAGGSAPGQGSGPGQGPAPAPAPAPAPDPGSGGY